MWCALSGATYINKTHSINRWTSVKPLTIKNLLLYVEKSSGADSVHTGCITHYSKSVNE